MSTELKMYRIIGFYILTWIALISATPVEFNQMFIVGGAIEGTNGGNQCNGRIELFLENGDILRYFWTFVERTLKLIISCF